MTAAAARLDDRFYVTAAIDYVNGSPHLGHAYEKVACDVLARHHALRIDERAGRREVAPFGALIYEPAVNNVYTYPNDTIYMYRDPQTFLAFGANMGGFGASGLVFSGPVAL